ncbi:LytR family transcriptional regulator [Spirochaetia bacterium]|nr:LytR family transcriptional regulator [Spirochaetia bacterium]
MKGGAIDASPFLLILIAVILGTGVFFTATALRQDPIEEALSGDRIINTLFIIEDRGKPLASYVLLYYPGTGKAAIFDVPGEVGLILRGINRVDRIDTLYEPQKVSPFVSEIGNLLGVDINFYVIFSAPQLAQMVDLIEGVEIFIPSPVTIYDGSNSIFFPSGLTRLDGDKARSYITYGLPNGDDDAGTFRRQRFFLRLLKRLGEQNTMLKNSSMAQLFQSLIKTSMPQRTQSRLFDELASIDTERITIQPIRGNIREVSGQNLLFPYYDGSLIKEIVRQSQSSLTRQVEGAHTERVFTVEVLNGTGTPGLARRTAELLRGFGYDVISIDNADRTDYEDTVIIDRAGFEDVVKTFAEIIRCDTIRSEAPMRDGLEAELGINFQNLEYKSDFTLIIGRDFNGRYVN